MKGKKTIIIITAVLIAAAAIVIAVLFSTGVFGKGSSETGISSEMTDGNSETAETSADVASEPNESGIPETEKKPSGEFDGKMYISKADSSYAVSDYANCIRFKDGKVQLRLNLLEGMCCLYAEYEVKDGEIVLGELYEIGKDDKTSEAGVRLVIGSDDSLTVYGMNDISVFGTFLCPQNFEDGSVFLETDADIISNSLFEYSFFYNSEMEEDAPVAKVTAEGGLKLRKLPSETEGEVITVIPEGETIKVYANGTNGWAIVSYDGKEGYAFDKYLETVK